MRIPNPLRHRSTKSAIINSQLSAATVVGVIIYSLILHGCSTPISLQSIDQCKILAANRVAKYKPFRQPKLNSASRSRTKSTQQISAGKGAHPDAIPLVLLVRSDTLEARELQPAPALHAESPSNFLFDSPAFSENKKSLSEKRNTLTLLHQSQPIVDVNLSHRSPFVLAGALAGISAFASILLLATFRHSFMKISAWAAHHPVTTKAALATVHTASSLGALIAGYYLARLDEPAPDVLTVSAAGGFIAAAMLYPTARKKMNAFSSMYLRQKVHDVSLFATGVVLSLSVGSHLENASTAVPDDPGAFYSVSSSSFPSYHPTLREDFIQDPPEKKEGKIALIIMSSILFTMGILLVAGLSCSLSCSGAGVAAVLLAVLGGGALIVGYIAGLRSIQRHRKIRHRKSQLAPA